MNFEAWDDAARFQSLPVRVEAVFQIAPGVPVLSQVEGSKEAGAAHCAPFDRLRANGEGVGSCKRTEGLRPGKRLERLKSGKSRERLRCGKRTGGLRSGMSEKGTTWN